MLTLNDWIALIFGSYKVCHWNLPATMATHQAQNFMTSLKSIFRLCCIESNLVNVSLSARIATCWSFFHFYGRRLLFYIKCLLIIFLYRRIKVNVSSFNPFFDKSWISNEIGTHLLHPNYHTVCLHFRWYPKKELQCLCLP